MDGTYISNWLVHHIYHAKKKSHDSLHGGSKDPNEPNESNEPYYGKEVGAGEIRKARVRRDSGSCEKDHRIGSLYEPRGIKI